MKKPLRLLCPFPGCPLAVGVLEAELDLPRFCGRDVEEADSFGRLAPGFVAMGDEDSNVSDVLAVVDDTVACDSDCMVSV